MSFLGAVSRVRRGPQGPHLFRVSGGGESVRVVAATEKDAVRAASKEIGVPMARLSANIISANVDASLYPDAIRARRTTR